MPLDHLTPQVVDIYEFIGYDDVGQRAFGPWRRTRGRFETADETISQTVSKFQGTEQVVRIAGKLWLPAADPLKVNDKAIVAAVEYIVEQTERNLMLTGVTDHVYALLSEE